MSQSPETPVTGWPEQPPEPAPYPAAEWTGPAGEASTMPQPVYPPETAQVHADPTQIQQVPGGYPEEGTGLPSEFDHLFRGSPQDSRRSIDRQRPAVGGAALPDAYQDPQFQAPGQSAAQYQPPGYEPAAAYQGPVDPPVYPPEQQQYGGHPEYPQAPGYGPAGYGAQGYPGPEYGNPEFQGGEFVGQGGGSGGWGPGGGSATSRNRKGWLIGGGIAVVAVIGIVYALNSGGGSGTPTSHHNGTTTSAPAATAQQQAAALYAIIAESGQLRSAANDAVVDVNACHNLAAAQTALQKTAQQRHDQADAVAKADVSQITNGAQLVQELQQAWSASAQYDSAYASIAGDVQNGCKPADIKKDANYPATNTQGTAASQAKVQAADLWNTNVAGPLGQQQISEAKL
jgi:hypothetical protein